MPFCGPVKDRARRVVVRRAVRLPPARPEHDDERDDHEDQEDRDVDDGVAPSTSHEAHRAALEPRRGSRAAAGSSRRSAKRTYRVVIDERATNCSRPSTSPTVMLPAELGRHEGVRVRREQHVGEVPAQEQRGHREHEAPQPPAQRPELRGWPEPVRGPIRRRCGSGRAQRPCLCVQSSLQERRWTAAGATPVRRPDRGRGRSTPRLRPSRSGACSRKRSWSVATGQPAPVATLTTTITGTPRAHSRSRAGP